MIEAKLEIQLVPPAKTYSNNVGLSLKTLLECIIGYEPLISSVTVGYSSQIMLFGWIRFNYHGSIAASSTF